MGWALVWAISLTAGLAFLLATLWGDYTWVARLGGAAWVAFLSLIVLSPILPSLMAKKRGE